MKLLINLIAEYHLYIMIAALLLPILLPRKDYYKKSNVMRVLILLLSFSIIYELALDEPVTGMPDRVTQFFNQSGPEKSANTHYWVSPEERYGFSKDGE